MYKQILSLLLIVLLTAAVVMFTPHAKQVMELLLSAHTYVSNLLSDVFSGGNAGNISKGIVAMLIVPVLAGFIPSLIYFLVRKKWCPWFMEIVWVIWLLQVGALVMSSTGAAVAG